MGRDILLTDQGTLEFKELASNGTAGVTIQSTADLTGGAGAYTLTLPTTNGGANEFLQTNGSGVLTWGSSTATLQSSYDNGAKITTASATPVEIEIGAASGNVGLLIDQDDDFDALTITKDGTGAGLGINLLNSGTGIGVFIDQDGAAIGLDIDQDGAAIAVQINQATANVALDITQQGAAAGLNVVGGAGSAITASNANDNRCLTLTKTGVGAGEGLFLENDGTGNGVHVQQDGIGLGCLVQQNTDATVAQFSKTPSGGAGGGTYAVLIDNASDSRGLQIEQDGDNNALRVIMDAAATVEAIKVDHPADSTAVTINKTGTGAGNGMTLHNDGQGHGLFVNQDGNGRGIQIDSEAASQPLIDLLPITGNSRGDIAFNTARTADPSSPSESDIWYNSTDEMFRGEDSGATLDFGTNTYKNVADPGDAGTITPPINTNFDCEFSGTTGNETRVLSPPAFKGQRAILIGSPGGATDVSISNAGGWTGGATLTTATFDASNQIMVLEGIDPGAGGAAGWRTSYNESTLS